MTEYYLPTGYGQGEFTEKKSRFMGQVWPVSTEEAAREKIEQVKKTYHEARHNCWCYLLRDGTLRYSDDGEPQGTAGQPMLEVFQREGITDCVCVVTRYFGGILLGTGGLARAYTRGAKDALVAAGVSVERLWDRTLVACPYRLYDPIRLETQRLGGILEETDFGMDVTLTVLTPELETKAYLARLVELSAGAVQGEPMDQTFRSVPTDRFQVSQG
jgi:uncharacterized YigZ family protein